MLRSDSRFGTVSCSVCVATGFALLTTVPAFAVENSHKSSSYGPLNYLQSFGSPGHEIRQILLALSWLSVAVVVIITTLVAIAILRRGRRVDDMSADTASVTAGHDASALRWIYAGLAATVVILVFFITWTVSTMATMQSPINGPDLTIEVTGHQWWWQVVYKDDDGEPLFETANEFHVPVGRPVRFVLRSADVIHSFWVPLLGGKTDMIPGQENVAWLRADTAGTYRGQCAEYCGLQHAHMAFDLFAMPPQEFDTWLAQRVETARPTADATLGDPVDATTPETVPHSNSITR